MEKVTDFSADHEHRFMIAGIWGGARRHLIAGGAGSWVPGERRARSPRRYGRRVGEGGGDDSRRRELAANLAQVRARVAAACADAGRDQADVTLIAVTKTRPAEDVVHLAGVGLRDIGENRDQEAAPKARAVAAAGASVRWHFVGRLQRNKARSVAEYADLVHTIDRLRLADAVADAAGRHDRVLDVLVQVSIDGDPERGGAVADAGDPEFDLDHVLARVAGAGPLNLRGLMAVAPMEWEPDRAFAILASIAERVRRDHPSATVLSAGMSGDMEYAIRYGATHLRVGTALLGNRPGLM
jgi:PLP dependent protein